MWKNIVKQGRPQLTIWRIRIAYWKPMATNTHSEYIILIAFPLQQWQQELVLMLRYTHMVRLVCNGEEMCLLRSTN